MLYTCFVGWVFIHRHIPDAKFFKEVLESYTTSAHSRIHRKPFPTYPVPH